MSQGWIQLSNALWPFPSFLFPGPHPSFIFCFQDPLSHPHTPHKYTDTYSSDTDFFLWHRIPPELLFPFQSSSSPCAEHLPSLLCTLQLDTNSPKQGLFTGSAFLAIWTLQHSFFLQACLTKSNKNTSGKYLLFRLFLHFTMFFYYCSFYIHMLIAHHNFSDRKQLKITLQKVLLRI